MKIWLYRLLQCTWGLPQTFLGLLVFAVHRKGNHRCFGGSAVTEWSRSIGLSLGLFLFLPAQMPSRRLLIHEYGHTLQSLILGPLYLFVVGLPSLLWATLPRFKQQRQEKHISYFRFYTERWADVLGEKAAKRPDPSGVNNL